MMVRKFHSFLQHSSSLNTILCVLPTDTKNPRKFLDMAAELIQIKENAKRMDEALDVAKEQNTTESFEKEYEQQVQMRLAKKFDVKKCSEFKNFKQQLQQIADTLNENANTSITSRVESDDFVMESEINIYDPLTKQRMQNPVRNTQCNHHYEKSSILEAIQINKRLRCPVAGCGNKEFVIQQHLVDDNPFKIRLQRMLEAEEED